MKQLLSRHRLGAVLAVLHIILFIGFLLHVSAVSERDGQATLLWMYWFPIDFPVSLLVFMSGILADTGSPLGEAIAYYSMHFVHGLLGPVWWFYLPAFIGAARRRLRSRTDLHR